MNNWIRALFILLFLTPFAIVGQVPDRPVLKPKEDILRYEKPDVLRNKLKPQTRFTGLFKGTINGVEMELRFQERRYLRSLYLVVSLSIPYRKKVFRGVTPISRESFRLENLMLLDDKGNLEIVRELYLHRYNPGFINLLTGKGGVGCFTKKDEGYISSYTASRFTETENFIGEYWGRIDGREAELSIRKKGEGYVFSLFDKEQKQEYWAFTKSLPAPKRRNVLEQILLRSISSDRKIIINELALSTRTSNLISGSVIERDKKGGLFFLKKVFVKSAEIPDFPWPPPEASDVMKLPQSILNRATTLGDLDRIISSSLDQSGYRFVPNKYFSTPNGFALVTTLEQVDCDAFPKEGDDRWQVESETGIRDFNILDYLISLIGARESLYRVFVFVVTDDLNPGRSVSPSLAETQGWLFAGNTKLPVTLSQQRLNVNHYCHVYIYEFSKEFHDPQARLIRRGQESCWRSGETHLRNSKILGNLNIDP